LSIRSITYYRCPEPAIGSQFFSKEGKKRRKVYVVFRSISNHILRFWESNEDPPSLSDTNSSAQQVLWTDTDSRTAEQLLDSNLESGLSQANAAERLVKYGPNQLPERRGRNIAQITL